MISKQLLIAESVSDEIKSWVSQNGFEVVGNLWDTEESNVFGFNTEDPQVDVYMDVSDDSSEVHVVLTKEGVAIDRKVFNMSKIEAEGFTVEDMNKIVEKFDKKAQDIPVDDNKFDRGERLMEIWKEHVREGIPLEFTTRREVIEWCEDNFGNSAVIGKNGEGILCYMEFGSALVISEYEGEPWLVNVSMFDKKKGSRKRSHSLWNATKDNDGNVLVHRTQAEREDFDDIEFVESKVANSLGLWGAALTDINDFQKLPTSIRDRFSLVASEMKKEGEAPPKVMSWSELNSAFSPENVESVKRKVVFGMKTRQASKVLDIPFIMAADLLEDYEKIGKKAMKDVVDSVKAVVKGRKISSKYGKVAENVDSDQENPKDILESWVTSKGYTSEGIQESGDDNGSVIYFDRMSKGLGQRYCYLYAVLDSSGNLKAEITEGGWSSPPVYSRDFGKVASSNVIVSQYGKVADKVSKVLSSSCPKVAVDSKAEEYWKAYYGPYGEQLVKEVKKRIKADLAKIWLTKQGVDEAAAEYWQNYFTDENYGEELTKDIPKRLSPKAKRSKKAQEIEKKYVVERMNSETREWWTGDNWSNVDTDAEWYDEDEAEEVADEVGGSATWFE